MGHAFTPAFKSALKKFATAHILEWCNPVEKSIDLVTEILGKPKWKVFLPSG